MKRTAERGFTLVEIMIVVAIIALLAAIAIPNVLRGRTTANETAAVGNLRALVSSLEMFRSVNQVYPLTANWTANMYTTPNPDFGPPSFAANTMVGANPGSLTQGYLYTFTGPAGGATYTLLAAPQTVGTTGTRTFLANESGLIRHCSNPPAGVALNMTDVTPAPTIDAAVVACD